MDLLNGIVNAILGPDTSQMSEADRKKTEQNRQEDRNKASGFAFDASNGNFKSFMRPETSVGLGSGGLEDMIKTVAKIFGGGGGG